MVPPTLQISKLQEALDDHKPCRSRQAPGCRSPRRLPRQIRDDFEAGRLWSDPHSADAHRHLAGRRGAHYP